MLEFLLSLLDALIRGGATTADDGTPRPPR